jgi:hypothetical protein
VNVNPSDIQSPSVVRKKRRNTEAKANEQLGYNL